MGIILNGFVTPAIRLHVTVQLKFAFGWLTKSAQTADSSGRLHFVFPTGHVPSPATLRMYSEGGLVDGVTYDECYSEEKTVYDGEEATFYLYPQPGEPEPPEPEPTFVTLKVSVIPAKPDLEITFWEYDGGWRELWGRRTDENGKVEERFRFSSYPRTMRVTFDPGQWIDGVEYGGYTSPDKIVNDDMTYNISLYPKAVGAAKGSIVSYDAPPSAKPGDTVTVSAEAKNVGTRSGSFRLRLQDRDENVDVDSTEWFTLAEGASTTKNLTATMPERDWNLKLLLERTLPTGAVAVDDEKKFTAINIVNWWDSVRAWWNGLATWQKALIVAGSAGGLIAGGATLYKGK